MKVASGRWSNATNKPTSTKVYRNSEKNRRPVLAVLLTFDGGDTVLILDGKSKKAMSSWKEKRIAGDRTVFCENKKELIEKLDTEYSVLVSLYN